MNFFTKKKICAAVGMLIMCVSMLAIGISPKEVHAQGATVPVLDNANLAMNTSIARSTGSLDVKEQALDKIFVMIAKQIIAHMTQSIVNWINSGFEGGPAFVTDPEGFFTDVADQVTGQFIDRLGLGFLCGSFDVTLQAALRLHVNYGGGPESALKRYRCTASAVADNISSGNIVSLNAFFDVAVTTSNNPYGAYRALENDLESQIAAQHEQNAMVLDWGNGFLSKKECDDAGNCAITTPGTLVEDQLVNVFGSGLRQLELADEINEVVNALASQLMNTMINKGLAGLSKAADGANSFADQLPDLVNVDVNVDFDDLGRTVQTVCIEVGPDPDTGEIVCLKEQLVDINTNEIIDDRIQDTADSLPQVPTLSPRSLVRDAFAEFASADGSVEMLRIDGVAQEASNVIDGRDDPVLSDNRPGTAITSVEDNPGVRIDLGGPMVVDRVLVHRATQLQFEDEIQELSVGDAIGTPLQIWITDENDTNIKEFAASVSPNQSVTTVDLPGVLGRYVYVLRTGRGGLALTEVEIEGLDIFRVQPANLGPNGTAQASGVFRSQSGPQNAIDNQPEGNSSYDWRFVSREARDQWWQVDLPGDRSLLDRLVIHHGRSGNTYLQLIEITITDVNGSIVYQERQVPDDTTPFIINLTNAENPYGVYGDVVRIQRVEGEVNGVQYSNNGYLELGEVEVIGRVIQGE